MREHATKAEAVPVQVRGTGRGAPNRKPRRHPSPVSLSCTEPPTHSFAYVFIEQFVIIYFELVLNLILSLAAVGEEDEPRPWIMLTALAFGVSLHP